MINSMTGFGRAQGAVLGREVSVEIRSVNNRFRDIIVRMPKYLTALEEPIKKLASGRVARGRVEIYIQIDDSAIRAGQVKLDLETARVYHGHLLHLKEEFNLAGEIQISDLTRFHDIIVQVEESLDFDAFMAGLQPVLVEALDKLTEMRQTEGKTLGDDFFHRLKSMEAWVTEIESRSTGLVEEYKTKLETRIKALTENLELDEGRLLQEIAYLVDRSDITEELVRLRSHVDQMGNQVLAEGPAGRRLEFLLQEMNREVNTIGSKSSDTGITGLVVNLKTELEKLREQAQNVE